MGSVMAALPLVVRAVDGTISIQRSPLLFYREL
jgi:hypothetical protein